MRKIKETGAVYKKLAKKCLDNHQKKNYNTVISKYNNITDINKINNIDKQILDFLLLNVKSFTTIKPSNIINKKTLCNLNLFKFG